MESYSLESGRRKVIKIHSVFHIPDQFVIEYEQSRWLCQFVKTTFREDGCDSVKISLVGDKLDSHCNNAIRDANQWRTNNMYLKIAVLKDGVCLYDAVGQLKDHFLIRDFFDSKMVIRQHPDLLTKRFLEMTLTIGTHDSLRTSCLTTLSVARDRTLENLGTSSLTTLPLARDRTLIESLEYMRDKGILTDIVLRTAEKDFPCHKVILASSSERFRAMFESDMPESSDGVVTLEQFDADTVQDLLYYLYTKKIPSTIKTTWENLLVAADNFQVTVLKEICSEKLFSIIRVENAASILKVAEICNEEALKDRAVEFVAQNFQEIILTPEWNSIPDQVVKKLLNTILSIISKERSISGIKSSFPSEWFPKLPDLKSTSKILAYSYSLESNRRKVIKMRLSAAFEADDFLIEHQCGIILFQFERSSRHERGLHNYIDPLFGQHCRGSPHYLRDIPSNTTPHYPPDRNLWKSKRLIIEFITTKSEVTWNYGKLKAAVLIPNLFGPKSIADFMSEGILEIALTIENFEDYDLLPDDLPACITLEKSLKAMLDKGILTDVVIRINKKDFPCHKEILASSSERFRAMFESGMSSDGVVTLEQFDADTVQEILCYLYTKKTPLHIRTTWEKLFIAADYFQVAVLKEICTQRLCTNIYTNNVASILELAETYKVEALRKRVMLFVAENFQKVILTPEWNGISGQIAKEMLITSFLYFSSVL